MTPWLVAPALALATAFAQAPKPEGTGSGALEVPGGKLRLQLNLKAAEAGCQRGADGAGRARVPHRAPGANPTEAANAFEQTRRRTVAYART